MKRCDAQKIKRRHVETNMYLKQRNLYGEMKMPNIFYKTKVD
jgi:hypothetical protein